MTDLKKTNQSETDSSVNRRRIAVVIPAYCVKEQIISLLSGIGPEVERIYLVDDCCPEQSGKYAAQRCQDSRLTVLYHDTNQGVGGATISGYKQALRDGMEIVIKLDGDGQMNPKMIPRLIAPLETGDADYVKGNRFYALDSLQEMPFLRLFGNSVLSFINKATSGYWDLMDPTNGYTAVSATALRVLPLEKIDQRFFFESDMLFRLGTIRAVVLEVPMNARYRGEKSNLRISRVLFTFPLKYCTSFLKRIFYGYFLRDFNVCSLQLCIGIPLVLGGIIFGGIRWYQAEQAGEFASAGTVVLAALPIILGFQLLLAAISYDIDNVPRRPLAGILKGG